MADRIKGLFAAVCKFDRAKTGIISQNSGNVLSDSRNRKSGSSCKVN